MLILFLLFQLSFGVVGNVANVVIEPELPIEGETIDVNVQRLICSRPSIPSEYVTVTQNDEISVFVRFFDGTCPDPPPPQFNYSLGAQINGLEQGIYSLRYYSVNESEVFPPLPIHYPLYFVEEIQFEVRGAPEPLAVSTASTIGILTLIFLMISVSFVFLFRKQ